MKNILFISVFILLYSCGNKSSSKTPTNPLAQEEQELLITEDSIEGQYLAEMIPLNLNISGPLDGSTTISINKDEFIGDVRLFGNHKTAQISFEQSVHIGDRCPSLADDLNQDGILDEIETLSVVRETLIPLDADLNAQWLGIGIYPLSDSFGSYYYSQIASLNKLLDDLWEVDINLEDQLIKMTPLEEPIFENKVVIIRGISNEIPLPSTVSFQNRRGVHASFPILCGVFKRVKSLPGRRNIDQYPYPDYQGENPDDGATIGIPRDDNSPDYDIEPSGPITNYGDQ